MRVKRRRNIGITEEYWSSLNEDKKFVWKVVSKIITIFGAWFVTKTGVAFLDGIIAACTSAFSFMLIESQRSHARYSVKMRKNIIRLTVALGVWGIFLAGALYFLEMVIFSLVHAFATTRFPLVSGQYGELWVVCLVVMMFLIVFYAVVKLFRDLDVIGLIYHLPRQRLSRLMVYKEFELRGGPGFVFFELSVVLVAICYSGVFSVLVSGALDIAEVFISAWREFGGGYASR